MAGPPAPHMAARDATRKINGAGDTLGAEEELNKYIQRVEDWGRGGGLQEAVGSFEERMGPIMLATGTGTTGPISRAGCHGGGTRTGRRGWAWYQVIASC